MLIKILRKIAGTRKKNREEGMEDTGKAIETHRRSGALPEPAGEIRAENHTDYHRPEKKDGKECVSAVFTHELRRGKRHLIPAIKIPKLGRNSIRNANPILIMMLIFLMVVFPQGKAALFIITLTGIAALSKLIQEPIPVVVGLDLCLFLTTVVSYIVNPIVGFVAGAIASVIGSYLRHTEAVENIVVPVLGYLWCAVITGILRGSTALWDIGVVVTLFYTLHNIIIFGFMRGLSIHSLTFASTSIPFNLFLFSHFGEKVAALLMG